jgi:hypothetical protein
MTANREYKDGVFVELCNALQINILTDSSTLFVLVLKRY